jgi:uncharacterized membrane protein YeaQ/YmgE (transglycosylase-associated protein family)
MQFLIWIVTGVIAGWLTGLVIKGRGFGLIGDLLIGLLGGFIGGWLAGFFGFQIYTWLGHVVSAAIGGIVLVAVVRVLRRA